MSDLAGPQCPDMWSNFIMLDVSLRVFLGEVSIEMDEVRIMADKEVNITFNFSQCFLSTGRPLSDAVLTLDEEI